MARSTIVPLRMREGGRLGSAYAWEGGWPAQDHEKTLPNLVGREASQRLLRRGHPACLPYEQRLPCILRPNEVIRRACLMSRGCLIFSDPTSRVLVAPARPDPFQSSNDVTRRRRNRRNQNSYESQATTSPVDVVPAVKLRLLGQEATSPVDVTRQTSVSVRQQRHR